MKLIKLLTTKLLFFLNIGLIVISNTSLAYAENPVRPGESGNFKGYDNMALLYGGNMGRKNALWTEERLVPHVSYVDQRGVEHWLFDAFLALEIYDRPTASSPATALGIGYGDRPAGKDGWQHFIDYWFENGNGFDNLNRVIESAESRLGPAPSKRKVVISIPDPVPYFNFKDTTSNTIYWGELNGEELDFSKGEDRLKACIWFVDNALKEWENAGYENLELEGFYCFSEELATKESGWSHELKRWEEVYPALSEYVHSLGYSMSWIPYNSAAGHDRWEKYHFDFVMMQPNYLWRPEYDMNTWKEKIKKHNLSMEIELDDKVRYGNPDWEKFRERHYYYYQMCKDLGLYGNCALSYYMGENTLHNLYVSDDPMDKKVYHDFCTFILGNQQ